MPTNGMMHAALRGGEGVDDSGIGNRAPVNSADDRFDIFVADEQGHVPVDVARWAALACLVLDEQGVQDPAEMSLLFVDEPTIAELNERFLGRQGPTDVLAFPIDEEVTDTGRRPDQGGRGPGSVAELTDPPLMIGDVVICPKVADQQAPTRAGGDQGFDHRGTLDDELALLVVHGTLHLLGFDHEEDAEAEAMASRERELLELFRRVGRNGSHDGGPEGVVAQP